ncbi:MAG: M56 family metallopeptidase [Planctomycetaceae bacterium]
MPNDLSSLTEPGILLVGTYLLHSTVWLLTAWCMAATAGRRSPILCEKLWRWAAVLPFVTTGGQFLAGPQQTPWTWTIPDAFDVSSTIDARQLASPPVESNHDDVPSSATPAILQDIPERTKLDAVIDAVPERRTVVPDSVSAADSGVGTNAADDSAFMADAGNGGIEPAATIPVGDARWIAAAGSASGKSYQDVAAAPSRAGWASGLAVGIVFWIIIGLLRVALLAMRTAVRVRRFPVLTGGAAETMLEDLRSSGGVRRTVRLVTANQCVEPAAFGLARWTIVLPHGIESQLDSAHLRAVLAHELAHLVRGDIGWLWIGRVLTTAFGWQPLNYLAVRRWREASEQLCDDWAVAGGVEPLTLARCLTSIAEWRLNGAVPLAGLAVIGRRSRLAWRIQRLTGPQQSDRWNSPARRRLLTVALLTLAGLLTWSGPHIVRATPEADVTPNAVVPVPAADTTAPPNLEAARVTDAALPDPIAAPVVPETALPDDSLSSDLDALRRDLRHALKLLTQTEPDPEITAVTERILQRVDALDVQDSEIAP